MAGRNLAIILGRLGQDPVIKHTQSGTPVVSMSIATSEKWTDKSTGQKQERTTWHKISVFGKQAENCEQYLQKGSQVYVEGRIETSQYEKEGQTHYSTSIIANMVQFLDSKGTGQNRQAQAPAPGAYQGGQGYQPPPAGNQYQQPAPGPQYQQPAGNQYRPPPQQGHQGPPPAQQHQQPPQGPPAQPGNQYQQQAPGGYQPPPAPVYDDTSLPF